MESGEWPAFPGNTNFATYFKDQSTGLDYADQRFYNSAHGFSRFMTADPYKQSAKATDSASWNKYSYTRNDPVNQTDARGLADWDVTVTADPDDCVDGSRADFCRDPSQNGGGGSSSSGGGGGGGSGGSGGGGNTSAINALNKVKDALKKAAPPESLFTPEDLDCISGIETGRTWNSSIVAQNGRIGLFQFDQANWTASGTSISWNGGDSAKDPYTAAAVAVALLYRKLGYDGTNGATEDQLIKAIDKFGENDGHYGQAVVDRAKRFQAGDYSGGIDVIVNYAGWKNSHR